MPARRADGIRKPVALRVDGKSVAAEEGEPVAAALVADGRWLFGRSVKYHRPRGPVCFDGQCDGCLMRVDGVPNVMTCRVPARDGMEIRTQNVLGSADKDLLSATDWFFPRGLDHHELFTRFKPLNQVMQKVARRIAGIGELPARAHSPGRARDVDVDVLVIGGGPAGLAAAAEAANGSSRVWLLEERARLGGHLAFAPRGRHVHQDAMHPQLAPLEAHARARGVTIACGHEAVAVYEKQVLVKTLDELLRFLPRRLVIATGLHEGPLPVAGNDRPGVLTPCGLHTLLRLGVVPGARIAVVGEGVRAAAAMEAISDSNAVALGPFSEKMVVRIRGGNAVQAVEIANGKDVARISCDSVVMASPPSSAFELAAQGGALVRWNKGSFVVEASPDTGATASPWLFAAGECTGIRELDDLLRQGGQAGRAAAAEPPS